jgi:hypothetical protein
VYVASLWYVTKPQRRWDPSDATYCYFRQKQPNATISEPSGPGEHENEGHLKERMESLHTSYRKRNASRRGSIVAVTDCRGPTSCPCGKWVDVDPRGCGYDTTLSIFANEGFRYRIFVGKLELACSRGSMQVRKVNFQVDTSELMDVGGWHNSNSVSTQ